MPEHGDARTRPAGQETEIGVQPVLDGRATEALGDFPHEIADQIRSFLVAVREVAAGQSPESAVPMLLLEVSQLLLAGGRLGAIRDIVPAERFEPDPGRDVDVDGLRSSLANLLEPIDEYAEVFDPYADPPEIVHTRLSDDLAGAAADLSHGLAHYAAGRVDEALWWWQFSYLSSWGPTVSSALRALASVVTHSRLDTGSLVDTAVAQEDTIVAETLAEAHKLD